MIQEKKDLVILLKDLHFYSEEGYPFKNLFEKHAQIPNTIQADMKNIYTLMLHNKPGIRLMLEGAFQRALHKPIYCSEWGMFLKNFIEVYKTDGWQGEQWLEDYIATLERDIYRGETTLPGQMYLDLD